MDLGIVLKVINSAYLADRHKSDIWSYFQLLFAVLMLATCALADGPFDDDFFDDDDGPFDDDFFDDDDGGILGFLFRRRFFGHRRIFGGRPFFGFCGHFFC